MKHDISSFIKTVRNPFKFKLFLLFRLPLAAIAGLHIISVDKDQAILRTRCWWLTQNPFKSTFWAVMGMAAEMSSGLLVMMYGGRNCSMYVTSCKATFIKRAVGTTFYTCSDGPKIKEATEMCMQQKGTAAIDCTTIVTNKAGDNIAEFTFTWSIKARS